MLNDKGWKICNVDATAKQSTPWRIWASHPKNTSFHYISESTGLTYVCVKEPRMTEAGFERFYWCAHKRINATLYHRSAGPIELVSLETLERVARRFAEMTLDRSPDIDEGTAEEWKEAIRQSRRRKPRPPAGPLVMDEDRLPDVGELVQLDLFGN